jgi:hypothetical protein
LESSILIGVIGLKHIKIGVIALILLGMVFVLTGTVCADQGVNATPETQSLGTTTTADVVGLVMESDAGTWTLTNDPSSSPTIYQYISGSGQQWTGSDPDAYIEDVFNPILAAGGSVNYQVNPTLGDPPWEIITYQLDIPASILNQQVVGFSSGYTYQNLGGQVSSNPLIIQGASGGIHTGVLDPGQIQYTTAYDANIVAQGGHSSFVKQMNLHTGNKVISQSNLNAQTGLTYAATSDGGNVVGSENLMLDGAGMNTTASDKILCPFASSIANAIPAYCNIVQAGSRFDLTIGSVTTRADNAFVHNDATIPVVLNYNINVKPYSTSQGQFPASGSTSAYIKAHIQEGRRNGTAKAEDLVYSETSSASGRITAFNKIMSYSSQITGSQATSMHIITPIGSGITPNTPVTVPDGGSATFLHAPHGSFGTSGYWLVDGKPGGEYQNYYTFTNVVSDHTISYWK